MVTTITKTIKPSGGDYATPQDAWNNIRTIVGSTSLPAADTAVVFEMYRGEYDSFTAATSNGYTLDATRNVTFRAAPGEGHGGKTHGGVRIVEDGTGQAVVIQESFVDLDGLTLVARNGNGGNYGAYLDNAYGCTIENCIILADGQYSIRCDANTTSSAATTTLRNVLAIGDGISADRYIDLRGTSGAGGEVTYVVANCSAFDSQYFVRVGTSGDATATCNVKLVNNFAGNCDRAYQTGGSGTLNVTGSNNIGPSTQPFPAAIQASGQTWDVTTDLTLASDGNNALYDERTYKLSSAVNNDALLVGIGPDADSDVPTSDILGTQRTGSTTQVGAFQSLHHIWSNYAMARNTVKIEGAISCGPGQISACFDVLSGTGAATDETLAIPQGTQALWMQQILPAGANSETITVQVLLDGSTAVTLMTMGGSSVDAGSAMGFIKLPFDVTTNDGTYPRIRANGTTSAWSLRVIAVGAAGPTWS